MNLRKCLLTALSALTFGTTHAQQNCLDFDGIDDKVNVPGASQFIAGSTQISMTFWVNPLNNVVAFPDYDGFAGFRNNSDADFYIIQLPGNAVEARFRNSSGANYDINFTGVQIGTWQHYALVYDGSNMTLYQNGVVSASTAASGSIANTAVSFDIGSLVWTSADFMLMGRMDEVSLWSIALSPQEVACIYQSGIDSSSAGLELYYNFNQGVAGGNNTAITTLTNQTGTTPGNLSGFLMNGTFSNFIAGVPSVVTQLTEVICSGESYQLGTQTLTQSGNYSETFVSSLGCDSIVQLSLTVNSVDTTVFQAGFNLGCAQAGATYQWLDCNAGYAPIPGAVFQTYNATANGSYAAAVTLNGCTDTSSCHVVTGVGLNETPDAMLLTFFPNPTLGEISLMLSQEGDLIVADITGRTVARYNGLERGIHHLDLSDLAKGTYFIRHSSDTGHHSLRLIRQ